jgi:cystinosin
MGKSDTPVLDVLSIITGWIYFFVWSSSFYGQVYENYKNKSVSGLNFDFEIYNFVGFSGYTFYTIYGYADKNMGTGTIAVQDICFAAHALTLTIITIVQIFIYYDKKDKHQKVSPITINILTVMLWGFILLLIVEHGLKYYDPHVKEDQKYIFNSLIYFGWCKIVISLIKYIPQVYLNYKRKSTKGWNIFNILMDFTGGVFSFLQNIIDYERNEFSIEKKGQNNTLNIAKFAISFIAIFFDVIFMLQHYVFYKNAAPILDILEEETNSESNENKLESQE